MSEIKSDNVFAESVREALAVRLEQLEATIRTRIEAGTLAPVMTPADPGKSIGDAVVRAVRAGAHKVEFVAGLLDCGDGHKEGFLAAVRGAPGEVGEHSVEYYDFGSGEWHKLARGTWTPTPQFRFPSVQDEEAAAVVAPGEGAIQAGPDGLRVKA